MLCIVGCAALLLEIAAAATEAPRPSCTEGVFNCLVNPCDDGRSCRAYPMATCTPNYCGGCNAEFVLDGTDVTAGCDSECPPPPTGSTGLCFEGCSADNPCPAGRLCCSNGCGRACMEGVSAISMNPTPYPISLIPWLSLHME